jgi:MATE family multidrug resistance protein
VLLPSITHMISYTLVMMPLSWALAIPAGLGLQGIVYGVIAASLISAGLLVGRFVMLGKRGL